MPLQHAKLSDIQTLSTIPGSIYANPVSTKTYLRSLVFHNTNTTDEVIKLYNVPDSSGNLGTAAAENRIASMSLAADETRFFSFDYPVVLTDTNDSFQAAATTAGKVTVLVLGDRE